MMLISHLIVSPVSKNIVTDSILFVSEEMQESIRAVIDAADADGNVKFHNDHEVFDLLMSLRVTRQLAQNDKDWYKSLICAGLINKLERSPVVLR